MFRICIDRVQPPPVVFHLLVAGRRAMVRRFASPSCRRRTTYPSCCSTLRLRRTTYPSRRSTLRRRRTTYPSRRSTLRRRRTTYPSCCSTLRRWRTTYPSCCSTLHRRRSTYPSRRSTLRRQRAIARSLVKTCYRVWRGVGEGVYRACEPPAHRCRIEHRKPWCSLHSRRCATDECRSGHRPFFRAVHAMGAGVLRFYHQAPTTTCSNSIHPLLRQTRHRPPPRFAVHRKGAAIVTAMTGNPDFPRPCPRSPASSRSSRNWRQPKPTCSTRAVENTSAPLKSG